jgi:hypothetical protein
MSPFVFGWTGAAAIAGATFADSVTIRTAQCATVSTISHETNFDHR